MDRMYVVLTERSILKLDSYEKKNTITNKGSGVLVESFNNIFKVMALGLRIINYFEKKIDLSFLVVYTNQFNPPLS